MNRTVKTFAAMGMAMLTAAAPVYAEAVTESTAVEAEGLQLGQIYTAAHGDKCFTQAVAVVDGDTVVAAYINDFQFMEKNDTNVAVPNSDAAFGEGYAEGVVLTSKRDNAESYSAAMAEKAGSTTAIDANFEAIEAFAAGKTIAELDEVAGAEDAVDTVSGATLVDTPNYLKAIADAARAAQENAAVTFDGEAADLKLNVAYGAAHGDKCFTSTAVVTDGTNIVLSYIDDFQFMEQSDALVGVPNSDAAFGEGYAEGVVLVSKRVNTDAYSANMAEKASATNTIDANFDAIQNHVNTLSIADAEALAQSDAVEAADAVSGATLVDTVNYVAQIVDTAKQ